MSATLPVIPKPGTHNWLNWNKTSYHVEGALVVVFLHELDGAFVLPDVFPEHHVLHPALIIRHIPPPQGVLTLLNVQG